MIVFACPFRDRFNILAGSIRDRFIIISMLAQLVTGFNKLVRPVRDRVWCSCTPNLVRGFMFLRAQLKTGFDVMARRVKDRV